LKKKLKPELRNSKSEMEGPMLFPRNPARAGTSGPQACFLAEKRVAKVGEDIISIDPKVAKS
jgi:hypothetical protein